MNSATWISRGDAVIMKTYSRYPAVMVAGSGCRLQDAEGREYLDFVAGIAVCSMGHCYPPMVKAVQEQAARLVHISNLYYSQPQIELAELLVQNSFADRVFFANSGAEANEAALKLARKYGGPERYEIISLSGSFHGRTLATVAATGQKRFHQGFEPLPAGFCHATFSGEDTAADLRAVKELIGPRTCGILLEPIQGEGGVRPLSKEFLAAVRQLCDQHDLLLIFDEVQVGMGRTGSLFAYEQTGVVPDVMTLAKALGNGLPIGVMLATSQAAVFAPGDHASTFGGNPVVCAGALAVMQALLAPGFLDEVREKGEYLAARLQDLVSRYPHLATEVRGLGLIRGLVLTPAGVSRGGDIVNELFQRAILVNFAGNTALRFIPPLVVTHEEIDIMIRELDQVLAGIQL